MRDQNRCFKCPHTCNIRQNPYNPRFKEYLGVSRNSVWLDELPSDDYHAPDDYHASDWRILITPDNYDPIASVSHTDATSDGFDNLGTSALSAESLRAARESMMGFRTSDNITYLAPATYWSGEYWHNVAD